MPKYTLLQYSPSSEVKFEE